MHSVPFGFEKRESRLVAHPVEAPILRRVFELFLEHGRKKTVARLLNDSGYRTREGKMFSDTAVGRMLNESIPNDNGTEIVVSSDLRDACKQLECENHTTGRKPVELFAGLLVCACGSRMYAPSNSLKYVCTSCKKKIPTADVEAVFFERLKDQVLVTRDDPGGETAPGLRQDIELRDIWHRVNDSERRNLVEALAESIVVGDGQITINLFLTSSEDVATKQHRQNNNKSTKPESSAGPCCPLKFNVGARELWEGKTQLTQLLNETTKSFLAVLALNSVNHINVPLDLDIPFADDASATSRSAVDMLRRQIGKARCRRLLRTERRRGNKAGGVIVGDLEIVGTGRREFSSSRV